MIRRRHLLAAAAVAALSVPAHADFTFTQGSGSTLFSFTSTTGGSALCAAASTHCYAQVPIDTAGAQLFASANAGYVRFPAAQTVTANAGTNLNTSALALDATVTATNTTLGAVTASPTANTIGDRLKTINTTLGSPFQAGGSIGNTTFAVTQGTAGNLNATVVGTGTFATQSTLAAETTKVIGTVRNLGNAGAIFDAATGAAAPANALQAGMAQGGNLVALTGTSGNLNVNLQTAIPAGANVIGHVIADTGSTTAVTQATASNLNATVVGSGAAGTAATGVVTVQGIASMTPLLANPGTAANWGVGATGSAVPANAIYSGINVAGNTRGVTGLALGSTFSPTVAIVDASGNQITSFGGSGGTASNYGSAFPSTGTAVGFTDGANMVAGRVGDVNNVAAATNYIDVLGVARYNATQPTLTDTRYNALQVSSRGELLVAVGTSGFAATVSQATAGNLNATVVGTGTFVTQSTLAAETTKVIGTVRTLGNAGAIFDAATGAAVPANGLYVGMNQGGNLTGLTGTSGNLNVQCANCSGSGVSTADEGTFTAGSSLFAGSGGFFQTTATNNALTNGQQGMLQVTAQRALFSNLRNASGTEVGTAGTPLQVSIANTGSNGTAVTVSATNLSTNVAQIGGNSVLTGGSNGSLGVGGLAANAAAASGNPVQIGGVYRATPSTLSDGNAGSALLDSSGRFRVIVDSATGVADATAVGSLTGSVIMGLVQTNNSTGLTNNSLYFPSMSPERGMRIAHSIPAATTMQNAATANGNGTSLNVAGYATAVMNVVCSVACSGGTTINFEGSVDDTTFTAISANSIGTNTLGTTTTAAGDFLVNVAGYKSVRARISAYSAGTITVKGYQSTASGQPYVINANIVANTATNQSVNLAQVAGTTTDTNSGNKSAGTQRNVIATDQLALATWGHGATGASAPSGAAQAGCRAQNAEATAVTNGQMAGHACDLTAKLINLPYANPENFLNGQITSAMTATTSTAVTGMGAQGAGVRVYATACVISNTHATVGTMVNLQDGSGGTVLAQIPAAPAYGGGVVPFPTPIKTTANTGLFAVNATTGSSTFVSCTGYKGA